MPITRLAPSPTGALHLGNARTFLVNWALARQQGWDVILRIEDLDGPRVKPESIQGTIDTLRWLGLDWQGREIVQSHDLEPYRDAMRALAAKGLAYPSPVTRSQIEEVAAAGSALSAPQEGGGEVAFPQSLRPAISKNGMPFDDEKVNWRVVIPHRVVPFVDQYAGPQMRAPWRTVGDFVVWTMRGQPAYQLAVVVDDARQGITHVVRGDDLLDSAARQIFLYDFLQLGTPPSYFHLPLICGLDGRRLAKRHGDTKLTTYRAAGVSAERIIGLLARWSGIGDPKAEPEPMTASEFAERFDVGTMDSDRVLFTMEDDQWLRASKVVG